MPPLRVAQISHTWVLCPPVELPIAMDGHAPTPWSACCCGHQLTAHLMSVMVGIASTSKYYNKTHLSCSSNTIFCSVLRNTLLGAICIGSVCVCRVASPETPRCAYTVNLEGKQGPPELRPRDSIPQLLERHQEKEEKFILVLVWM